MFPAVRKDKKCSLVMKSHNDNSDTRKDGKKSPARSLDSAGLPRPTPEEIRLRAYEIYVERGRIDGQELDDWFQAERELTEIIHISTDE